VNMDRGMAFAQDLDRTMVAFKDKSFEELERALMVLEEKWVATSGAPEALEYRRRTAEALFTEAFQRDLDWPRFSACMERVRVLGYSHLLVRVHVAALFARWAHRHREHELEARQALDDVEEQVVRADQRDPTIPDLRITIDQVRVDTGYRPPPAAG